MRSTAVRRLVATAAVVPLLAGLAACRDDGSPNAVNTPALAGPPATATPAAGVEGVARISLPQFVAATRKALATKRGVHIDLEIVLNGFTVTTKADEHLNPGRPVMRSEVATSSAVAPYIDMIQTSDRILMNIEGYMPKGKWADLGVSQQVFGPDAAILEEQLDPMSAIISNRAGFQSFTYRGSDTMYGVPMARYTLAVDAERALRARGISARTRSTIPGKRFTYELWLDQDRMVCKVRVKIGRMRIAAEMSKWGKPVRIAMPRSSDIVQMPTL